MTVTEFNDANPGVLANVLKYHIVNSDVQSKDITDGQVASTSLGQDVTFTLEANPYYPEYDIDLMGIEETSIYVNEARVFARDAKATNGTIHVINAVLTPAGS